MSVLVKAEIVEVSADPEPQEVGTPIPVQFNPASLKLKYSNELKESEDRGRQRTQYIGSSATVLTLDLEFDSADEGTTRTPRPVTGDTNELKRFMLPQDGEDKQTVPKMRFAWGDFVFDGIVQSLSVDLEHFASDGTPLRAKVSLSIKEQDSKFVANTAGPGANDQSASGLPTAAAAALAGETAADFLARQGLDPSAWTDLGLDLSAGVTLDAGVEIGFDAGLSVSTGIGASLGVEVGVDVSLDAALSGTLGMSALDGTSASSPSSSSPSGSSSSGGSSGMNTGGAGADGTLLAAAGGVAAAIETARIAETTKADAAARAAFAAPAAESTTPVTLRPPQPRAPLAQSSGASASPVERPAAEPAPRPTRADRRAISYGYGVPLRPRRGEIEASRFVVLSPKRTVASTPSGPPIATGRGTPPWEALRRATSTVTPPTSTTTREAPRRPARRPAAHARAGRGRRVVTTRIDRTVSEMVAEPEPTATAGPAPSGVPGATSVKNPFEQRRDAICQQEIERRVAAEGFDD